MTSTRDQYTPDTTSPRGVPALFATPLSARGKTVRVKDGPLRSKIGQVDRVYVFPDDGSPAVLKEPWYYVVVSINRGHWIPQSLLEAVE